jgi:hypothetical protein
LFSKIYVSVLKGYSFFFRNMPLVIYLDVQRSIADREENSHLWRKPFRFLSTARRHNKRTWGDPGDVLEQFEKWGEVYPYSKSMFFKG